MDARRATGNDAAGSEDEGFTVVQAPAVDRWARLIRLLHRIRRLQRIWGLLGQHLQTLIQSREFRRRVLDRLR